MSIRLRQTGDQLMELLRIYNELVMIYKPEDAHEDLLLSHAIVMRRRLAQMALKGQARYLYTLNDPEATAFQHLWQSAPMPLPPYSRVMIDGLIGKIDQEMMTISAIINRLDR